MLCAICMKKKFHMSASTTQFNFLSKHSRGKHREIVSGLFSFTSKFRYCFGNNTRSTSSELPGAATYAVMYTVVAVIITVLIPRNYMAVTLLITVM